MDDLNNYSSQVITEDAVDNAVDCNASINNMKSPAKKKNNKSKLINQNINKFFLSDIKNNNKKDDQDDEEINLILGEDDDLDLFNSDSNRKLKKVSKLLKKKEILKQEKKKARKHAKNLFLDEEAQLGSDNEEHDDLVRQDLDSDYEYDRIEGEKEERNDLQEEEDNIGLIDKDYEMNVPKTQKIRDEEAIYEKYFSDEMKNDKEMIKKIINFDHNKKKNKYNDNISEDDDYIPLQDRMKIGDEENEDKNDGTFKFQMLGFLHQKREKKKNQKANYLSSDNEEAKEIEQLRKEALIKRHAEKNPIYLDYFKKQMRENDYIIKNHSINLNEISIDEVIKPKNEIEHDDKTLNKKLMYINNSVFYSRNNSAMNAKNSRTLDFFNKKPSKSSLMTSNHTQIDLTKSNSLTDFPVLTKGNSVNNTNRGSITLSSLWLNKATSNSSFYHIKNVKETPEKVKKINL